jgi:hypothetical protein
MNLGSVQAMMPIPADTLSELPATTVRQSIAKYLVTPWALTIATCLLLATSGGIRFWRDHQFRMIARENENCPFVLTEERFPKVLGSWYADEQTHPQLDPEIARIAGANAYVLRNYIDKKSGAVVLALILYGPADSVFGHTPEVCYPAGGYKPVGPPPKDHKFDVPASPSSVQLQCRSAFFSKSVDATTQYVEVYYTFYHNGQWLPEVANQWKLFRYHPGMFKVLLQRQTTDLSAENSPSESLLKEIVHEVSVRIGQNKAPAAAAMTPVKTGPR